MCYRPPGFAQHGLSSILGAGRKKSVPAKNSGVCLREEEGEQVAATKWQSDAEAAVPVWEVTGAPCQQPRRLLFLLRCRPHGRVRPVEMVEEASGSPDSSGNPLPSLLQLEKIGKCSKWRLLRYSSTMRFGNFCSLGLWGVGPGRSYRMWPWELCYEAVPACVIAAPYPSLVFKSFQH